MKLIVLCFLLILFFFRCTNQTEKENIFIIQPNDWKVKKINDSTYHFPGHFYGLHNFILVNSSTIYYYNYNIYECKGTSSKENYDPRKILINLKANKLTKVKLEKLPSFLRSKLPYSSLNKYNINQFALIASPTDTINNKAFSIIVNYLIQKKEIRYNIRRCTNEEESLVIK